MPWNGSGQFNRDTGVFTGATVWDDSRIAGRTVRSDDHDTHDEDIATGLENTVTRDGQNSASANLPMATFRHTNVGNAAARTDYAAAGQIQDQGLTHIVAASVGGTADAITLSPTPAITAYAAGQRWSFLAEATNTGAVTVDVSTLGTRAVQKVGVALVAGDVTTSNLVEIEYDGTQFQMLSPSPATAFTNIANTFTANQTISSTDAGPTAGPTFDLHRDSASPAADDDIGAFICSGESSTGVKRDYATFEARIGDPTNGAEFGIATIETIQNGVSGNRVFVGGGMHSLNVGGGDKGIDTVNFQSVFANGFVLPALKGLQLSNHTDAAHDIQITSGLCSDDANSEHMHLGSLIVKQIDAAWAVGTNQGGLDGSESVPGTPDANTWYHLHVIKRTDTGIVDVLFSESATAPTLPTNYTKSRRVGSVLTDGSANILGFSQVGDDFLKLSLV